MTVATSTFSYTVIQVTTILSAKQSNFYQLIKKPHPTAIKYIVEKAEEVGEEKILVKSISLFPTMLSNPIFELHTFFFKRKSSQNNCPKMISFSKDLSYLDLQLILLYCRFSPSSCQATSLTWHCNDENREMCMVLLLSTLMFLVFNRTA